MQKGRSIKVLVAYQLYGWRVGKRIGGEGMQDEHFADDFGRYLSVFPLV